MPKIAAANIEEHIRNQEKRILDSARELFTTHGYRDTDMADIAESMGLARNSLYRYYSNKDHILIAVVRNDMAPFFAQLEELEETVADPSARIDAWLELQMEIAAGPCHAMMSLLGEIPRSSRELREQISALHEPPKRVLQNALEQLLEDAGRDVRLLSVMITSMVQSTAGLAMSLAADEKDGDEYLEELKLSVNRILHACPAGRRTEETSNDTKDFQNCRHDGGHRCDVADLRTGRRGAGA